MRREKTEFLPRSLSIQQRFLNKISHNLPGRVSDIEVKNEEAISQVMECLVKNPQLAKQMGMAARKRMKEWKSAEQLAERLLAHLESLNK